MKETFNAIVAEDINGKTVASIKPLSQFDLPDEPVLVAVDYSTLNYKDGLAVSGKGKICRTLPLICGIDLSGTVVSSQDARWQPGDNIVVNGYGMSETFNGGYSQYQRVKAEWPVKLPQGLSTKDAMAIGTAGYTAMLCVQAIQRAGVTPESGPVLVTGANGGVGSFALRILQSLGYEAWASTGRMDEKDHLKAIGATDVIDRAELSEPGRPLQAERWAAAIDSVGSHTLANVCAQIKWGGAVAACGLAQGMDFPSTVAPFILRGITLYGVDSVMQPVTMREQAWAALAEIFNEKSLAQITEVIPFDQAIPAAHDLLAGKIRGRVAVKIK
ncbi:MAG: hypothetical protein RL143_1158 [Pseudomonadota bacterium]